MVHRVRGRSVRPVTGLGSSRAASSLPTPSTATGQTASRSGSPPTGNWSRQCSPRHRQPAQRRPQAPAPGEPPLELPLGAILSELMSAADGTWELLARRPRTRAPALLAPVLAALPGLCRRSRGRLRIRHAHGVVGYHSPQPEPRRLTGNDARQPLHVHAARRRTSVLSLGARSMGPAAAGTSVAGLPRHRARGGPCSPFRRKESVSRTEPSPMVVP
jgi:hypothetical protein